MTDTRTLSDLVAEVSAELRHIPKNGKAPEKLGGFAFVQIVDVMDKLKPELDSRGIVLRPLYRQIGEPIIRERGDYGGYTLVLTVELELYACKGGDELLLARTIGMGADTQDKASGKAQSSALKEAILKAFAIPTGDDPEAHELDEQRPRQQRTRATQGSSQRSTSSAPASTGKAGDVARINALLKALDDSGSQTANRYSVRAHVSRTMGHESVGSLLAKGSDEQRRELIAYLEDKVANPTDAPAGSAEAMSDDDAIAAGASLVSNGGPR